MGPGSFVIIALAFLRVVPVLLGTKTCRKYGLGAVLNELREQIPENGAGPVIAERRDAVRFLQDNCRQCARCRLGREA